MKLFRFIKAHKFFKEYAPHVRNFTHKMRGKDGNKNAIDFSLADRRMIKRGFERMVNDLERVDFLRIQDDQD